MADGASRSVVITDWSLKESIAGKVFRRFGTPDKDLMATQSCWKVPRFIN